MIIVFLLLILNINCFTTSQRGIDLITSFEGCELTAYWDQYGQVWTIGYGHTGSDVYQGLTITQAKAQSLLQKDLKEFEKYVNNKNYVSATINQNQFDALVSFTYNCGPRNLKELCYGKTISQIANEITLYNKSGGQVLAGLVRRREAEKKLFLDGSSDVGPGEEQSSVIFTYAVRTTEGKVLPEVTNTNDYAGKVGVAITDIAIKVNKGTVKYRVHVKDGNWLGWVTGYSWSDYNNGYAGNGKPIDLVQISASSCTAKYRVSPLNSGYYSWQLGDQTGGGYDGYAGTLGKAIDRFQVYPS
jgi:GH24 family phage-related lysozyme (muramidase)